MEIAVLVLDEYSVAIVLSRVESYQCSHLSASRQSVSIPSRILLDLPLLSGTGYD